MNKLIFSKIEDGKDDILIIVDGITLRVEEKMYKSFGFTYEDMNTRAGLCLFLTNLGSFLYNSKVTK